MRYGIILASLLVCCCVNHLWAAAIEVQPGAQFNEQLAGSSREPIKTMITPHAIGPTLTPFAATSFRRTRKLLIHAARTQQRQLRQIIFGANIKNSQTLPDAGIVSLRQAQPPPQQAVVQNQPALPEPQQLQQPAPAVAQPVYLQQQLPAAEQPVAEQPTAEQAAADLPVVKEQVVPLQFQVPAAVAAAPAEPGAGLAAGQAVAAAGPKPTPLAPAEVLVAAAPAANLAASTVNHVTAAQATEAEEAAKSKNFDSWNTSPTCKYRKSVDNFNLDTLGRPWGFDIATKQSCTFQDISAPQISWEDAKDCPYELTDSNALPDSQGRLWGFDAVAMQGCAFKSQSLPAGRFEAGDMTPGLIPTGIAHAGTTSDSHLGLALAHFLNPSAAAAIPPGPHIIHLPDPRQQAPSAAYCIPVNNKNSSFHVLAAGDSITQGSVPSRNLNYPYTIKLEELLRRKLGPKTRAMDAGLGGGGIYQAGFSIPKMFPEFYLEQLDGRKWDVAVIMIGINDLLRGSTPAADIMAGLQPLIDETLAKGVPVIAIPPFAAPGFVAENDSKEAERKKMAVMLKASAEARAAATRGQGPQMWVLDLQAGPLDFYKMSPEDRSRWLDDGLHMTQFAYEQLGQYVYDEVLRHLCNVPLLGLLDYAHVSAQEASYGLWREAARARP